MALMISTGYSSLMSPDEFEKNLNNAMSDPTHTFKDMKSQEPGLNESFEYYRVVERFVATQFNDDKELLSLAIAAGKFGDNTEFMWTLYNLASMGALRVDGREEIPYERKFSSEVSEDIIDSEEFESAGSIKKIELIKSYEKPEIEQKQTENHFLENVKHSVKAKLQKVADGDKKLSELLNEIKTSYELKCLLSENLVKILVTNQVKDENGNTFKETIKQLEARLFLIDPIIDDFAQQHQEIAQDTANKIEQYLKYSKTFYGQLKKFNKDELIFISSNQYYEMYKKAFTLSNLYKGNDQNLDEDNFNKLLIASLKNKIKNMDEEELCEFENNISNQLNIKTYAEKRRYYFDLIKNIPESIDDLEEKAIAKNIAKKIKQSLEGVDQYSDYNLFDNFNIDELIFILSEPNWEKYRKAMIGCGKYIADRFLLLESSFYDNLFMELRKKIIAISEDELEDLKNEFNEGKLCAQYKDEVGSYIKTQSCFFDLIKNIPESIDDPKDKAIAKSIAEIIKERYRHHGSSIQNCFDINELIFMSSDEFYESYKKAIIGFSSYLYYVESASFPRNLDENGYNAFLAEELKGYIKYDSHEYVYSSHGSKEKKSSEEDLNNLESRCGLFLSGQKELLDLIAERKVKNAEESCYLDLIKNIPEYVEDEKDKAMAKSIANTIEAYKYNDIRDLFNKFNINELALIASSEYYEEYKDSFIGSNRYKEYSNNLDENIFKKVLSDRIKNNTYNMRKEDFSNLESRFHQDLKNRGNSNNICGREHNSITYGAIADVSSALNSIKLDGTLDKNAIERFKNRIKNMSEE